jgi:hypothetical protein
MVKKYEPKRDKKREDRIAMEAVVDAYNESERAMSWYYNQLVTVRANMIFTARQERWARSTPTIRSRRCGRSCPSRKLRPPCGTRTYVLRLTQLDRLRSA